MPQTINIDGLANARDLGGLARSDGSFTPHGTFVRTEILDRVTPGGWQELADHGIRTVIDLRRPDERSGEVPAPFARISIDLDGSDPEFWGPREKDGTWGTPLYYSAHMELLPDRLTEVLDAIATAEGGVLFHCGAGWDRTGLVASVLLRALDVTPEAAASDYLQSFENEPAMRELHERSFHVSERRIILDRFGHTPESAFAQFYRSLDLAAWFDHAGISESTRTAVVSWRGAAGAVR